MKHLAHLNKYFFKYKWYLVLGIIFTVISNLFGIMPAQMVRKSLDAVKLSIESKATDQIFGQISYFGLLIIGMAMAKGVFLFAVRQTLIVMSRHIEFDLKNEIYAHYQTLPLSFYKKNSTGDLLARVSEDVGKVRMYVGPSLMYLLNMAVMVVLIVSYMFSVNVRLSMWVLLPLPFLSYIIFKVSSTVNKKSEQIQKSLSSISTFVQEAFSGIRLIKTFVREPDFAERFNKESQTYRDKSMNLTRVESLFSPTVAFLVGLSIVLCVYIGGQEVVKGTLTVGNITEFILYVTMLTWPMTALGWTSSQIQRAAASQARINEFLFIKNDLTSSKNLKSEIQGEIEFVNADFTYTDTGIKALHNFSLKIKSGQSVAILGTTGSGKTTLAHLIPRLFDVSGGDILIDNRPIRDFNVQYLRSQIGYVPQETFLFSESILNNARFGSDDIDQDLVIKAIKDADLFENTKDFPNGLETVIGERGVTLSGGQKQRLAIARAIARAPKILILDDCLSAVDTQTEARILENLKQIMKHRTTLIISHRVSSARLVDHIVMLHEGAIVEQGSHDELLLINGSYADLYEKQMTTEDA